MVLFGTIRGNNSEHQSAKSAYLLQTNEVKKEKKKRGLIEGLRLA